MLLLFWEIKEKTDTKKNITRKLNNVEIEVKKIVSHQSPAAKKNSTAKVIFTNSAKIRNLNKIYRHVDKETDVLTFAELDMGNDLSALKEKKTLGEIYINYDWVILDKSPLKLVSILFVHGYLHLLGYDHEKDKGEMEKIENSDILPALNLS